MPDDFVTISNGQLLALMSDQDREITRSIYETKSHLSPRELVELAYMMGRSGARVGTHPKTES